jgi:glycosyltransferase involved in cell wall biosynthesis
MLEQPQYGVDTGIFKKMASFERQKDVPVIAYVGRLEEEKGVGDLFIAAGSLFPQCRLRVVGDGTYRKFLERMILSSPFSENISLEPAREYDRIPLLLNEIDVLVLPSRTTPVWKEQFGRILVEAMACGVSVIGSDSGAIPDVIGDAGLLYPEGDTVSLSGRIKMLIENESLRKEYARRGRERVATMYSNEILAEHLSRFLTDCLRSFGTRR